MVSTQLEEQLQTLEKKPDAISMPAIEKELEGRLKKVADGQRAQRAGQPLRPSYDVFTRVNEAVPAKSRSWFDQRVSDVGNRVREKVATGERPLPTKDEEALRQLILANPAEHHQRAASLRAAQPTLARNDRSKTAVDRRRSCPGTAAEHVAGRQELCGGQLAPRCRRAS